MILTLCSALTLGAQTPVKRLFGVGDDEFFKSAWMKVRPDSAGVDDSTVWAHAGQFRELADSLGINILRIHGGDFNFRLADSIVRQRTRIDQRLISASFGPDFSRMSIGREIRFPVIADDENMLVPR